MSFRAIRIAILLAILLLAAGTYWWEMRTVRAWRAPLDVVIYPLNGDGSARVDAYIRSLGRADFADIDHFVSREARRYGVRFEPALRLTLGSVAAPPPLPQPGQSALANVWWSLRLRAWVYRHTAGVWPQLGRIKVFVLYHTPRDGVPLAHSLGLQKGLIGIVHAFADPHQTGQNALVIAHELLHTLGATDKYDRDGRPVYPAGYADPALPPDVPRQQAEIMAGRLITAAGRLEMPASLAQCVIGPQTAREIGFDDAFRRD